MEIDDSFKMELFENIPTYEDFILDVDKSIYNGVIWDSLTERNFAEKINGMKNVKLFIKLPDWFVVKTSIGEYNPDWSIVMECTDQHGQITDIH